MKPFKHFLIFTIIFVFPLHFSGCASLGPTEPNLPFGGNHYPSMLIELAEKNPLLVQELGKLPELQNGFSQTEAHALRDIAELYNANQAHFEKAFNEMYKIGLPEVRKYCSPLQALYWLAESGELRENRNIIEAYWLKKLLDRAWKFEDPSRLTHARLTKIIQGIRNDKMRNDYVGYHKRHPMELVLQFINDDYRKNEYAFSKEARQVIENIKAPRWKDFDVVTERLNAPELIDYYERRRFWYGGHGAAASLQYLFKHNVGRCDSITGFTVYCLRKGGYRAKEIRVPGYTGPFHVLTLFEMNGKKYIMDNGMPIPAGIRPYAKR